MEFITKYSESVREGSKEFNSKPSMTEPDNSMSIPEIIARFTRGQGLQVPVHSWEGRSAFEDGQPVQDNELEDFLELHAESASLLDSNEPVDVNTASVNSNEPPSPAPAPAGE